jgi:hypothetical protein
MEASMDLTPENTPQDESFNLSSYRRPHASPQVEQVAYWIKGFNRVPREYDLLETAAKNLLEELAPLTDEHTLDVRANGITYNIKKCAIDLEHALEDLVQWIPSGRSKLSDDVSVQIGVDRACREVRFHGKHFLAAASEV